MAQLAEDCGPAGPGVTPIGAEAQSRLDEGRIIESGSHRELMELKGTYADFVELQTA